MGKIPFIYEPEHFYVCFLGIFVWATTNCINNYKLNTQSIITKRKHAKSISRCVHQYPGIEWKASTALQRLSHARIKHISTCLFSLFLTLNLQKSHRQLSIFFNHINMYSNTCTVNGSHVIAVLFFYVKINRLIHSIYSYNIIYPMSKVAFIIAKTKINWKCKINFIK